MAYDYLLEISAASGLDFAGTTTLGPHANGYRIGDWSFTAGLATTSTVGGGKAAYGPIQVSFGDLTGITDFLNALRLGTSIPAMTLYGIKTTPDLSTVADTYRLRLGGVTVTDVSEDSGGYSVTLAYTKIAEDERQNPSATFDSWAFDTSRNVTGNAPALVTTNPVHVDPTNTADYFVKFAGITPLASAAGHPGSVHVVDQSFEFVGHASNGAVGGVAANVSLTLGDSQLLPQLQSLLDQGRHLSDVTLYGGKASTSLAAAAATLELKDCLITSLDVNADGSLNVGLSASHGTSADLSLAATDSQGAPLDASFSDRSLVPSAGQPYFQGGSDAPDAYMVVDGVVGDHKINGNSALKIANYELLATAEGGTPSYNEISLHVESLSGLLAFHQALAQGTDLSSVTLYTGKADRTNGSILNDTGRIRLGHAHVTSITQSAGGGYDLTLAYDQIGTDQRVLDNSDGSGSYTGSGFDLRQGTALDFSAEPAIAVSKAAPSVVTNASQYFVQFGNLVPYASGETAAPSSTSVRLTDFSWSEAHPYSPTAGAQPGKYDLGSITIWMHDAGLYPQLQKALATGSLLSSVDVVGVAISDRHPASTIYDYAMSDVHVVGLTQLADGAISATLVPQQVVITDTSGVQANDNDDVSNGGYYASKDYTLVVSPGDGVDFSGAKQEDGNIGLDVIGLSYGSSAPTTATGGAGRPEFGDLKLTLSGQAGLTSFLSAMQAGTHLPEVTLYGPLSSSDLTASGDPADLGRLRLGNALVTHVEQTSDGNYTVSLAYDQIGEEDRQVANDGTLANYAPTFAWDVGRNRTIALPTLATNSNIGPTDAAPDSFVAHFSGLTPDAPIAGLHTKSVGVDGFSISYDETPSRASGALTAGTPAVSALTLYLSGTDLLTELQNDLSTGRSLSEVTLFGDATVRGNTGMSVATTLEIDVTNAFVTGITQGPDTVAVTLAGRGYTISTWGINAATGGRTGGTQVSFGTAAVNHAPTGSDRQIAIGRADSHPFAASDFGFADGDGNGFAGVILTSLPAAGALTLAGAPVAVGQAISVGQLDNLVYATPANAAGGVYATLGFEVRDNGGTLGGGTDIDTTPNTLSFVVPSIDDHAATAENATTTIAVLANDGLGAAVSTPIVSVSGQALASGNSVTLASGAIVTLNADNTITYDPHHAFDYLVSAATAAATGVSDAIATDSFTYLNGAGVTGTVSVMLTGVDGAGDKLLGSAGDDTITLAAPSLVDLSQGGVDSATGSSGDDGFFVGAVLTAADHIDGGGGANDQVGLQGDYSGAHALVLGATTLVHIDALAALPGGATPHSYVITSDDATVAAGQTFTVFGGNLAAGESFSFDGSAETDGSFMFFGGAGTDTFIGGAGADGFYFGPDKFGSSDVVHGGGGTDQLGLDGHSDALTLDATHTDVETIALLRGPAGQVPDSYGTITVDDSWVLAGQTKTITAITSFGTSVGPVATSLVIDGSRETDGSLNIYGGSANDRLTGGAGSDHLYGGAGADTLTGGGGSDVFSYNNAAESTGTAFDTLTDFDLALDRLSIAGQGSDSYTSISGGRLDQATFDADLKAAVGAQVSTGHAAFFTASAGSFAGQTFLVVDANGVSGYQAGGDYVFHVPAAPAVLAGHAYFITA